MIYPLKSYLDKHTHRISIQVISRRHLPLARMLSLAKLVHLSLMDTKCIYDYMLGLRPHILYWFDLLRLKVD